jgi:hypothetical protein
MLVDAIPKLHMETTLAQLMNVCHIMQIDPRTGVKSGNPLFDSRPALSLSGLNRT